LLLHNTIASAFLVRLKARAEAIQIDDPLKTGCRLGPLVNERQFRQVQRYIQSGIQEGAKLLTGGPGLPDGMSQGYFTRPTVFVGVTKDMTIWREEIFGPVLSVMEFSSDAEAVKLANDSTFGLAGAVISKDAARCKRMATELQTGIVWINCSQPCFCQVRPILFIDAHCLPMTGYAYMYAHMYICANNDN
jgi:betaine-aldehyde dehydrogenase